MKIKKIFQLSDIQLKEELVREMVRKGYDYENMHETKDFLYIEGDAPYMLVAHLDTVHKHLPSIICRSADGNYLMSPYGIGGDDRCGVIIILALLAKLPFKPYVLFTMGEEKGGLGANAFIDYMCETLDIPDLKYIVEYDRKGNNDCVFYRCDNKDFTKFVEGFGFKEAHGSFTDISVIAPEFGCAAVNISSGYFNPHTEHEYVCVSDMKDIIERSTQMLCAECDSFEYIEKPVPKFTTHKEKFNCRKISVTILPANTMRIHFSYSKDCCFLNKENEIAVDEKGNLYRYFQYYHEWESAYNVSPNGTDFIPKYDPNTAQTIELFYCDGAK